MVGEERLCDKPKEYLHRRLHVVLPEYISSEWMGTDVCFFLLFTCFFLMVYNFETGAKCTVHNIIHCEFFLSQI